MSKLIYAYLAGALDADGSFGIKRSTYHKRVLRDADNPTFSETVALKQVTPQVPQLLKDTFGGYMRVAPPNTPNSRPAYVYVATDRVASEICRQVMPYLRIKQEQASTLLVLRHTKEKTAYQQHSYWFLQNYPNWESSPLITSTEAAELLGYTHVASVSQAIRKGTLVALPYDNKGQQVPRIPLLLVERIASEQRTAGRRAKRPPELISWREELYQKVRELNKTGVDGTPVYHKSGYYTPAEQKTLPSATLGR